MAKDPAFLFYPKDWLEGTSELSPTEKGVYIDLLANQHQKGDLPKDTARLCRLVSLSEADFLPIWEVVKTKFLMNSNDRLTNKRLTEVMTERSTKSHTNKITGRFAVLIRSVEPKYRPKLKEEFEIDNFNRLDTEKAIESLTEWFKTRYESIVNEYENTSIVEDRKEGVGERKGGEVWYDETLELPPIHLEAAERNQYTHTQKRNTEFVKEQWKVFLIERSADPPFKQLDWRTVDDLAKYFLNFIRTKFPKKNGQHVTSTVGKETPTDKF